MPCCSGPGGQVGPSRTCSRHGDLDLRPTLLLVALGDASGSFIFVICEWTLNCLSVSLGLSDLLYKKDSMANKCGKVLGSGSSPGNLQRTLSIFGVSDVKKSI